MTEQPLFIALRKKKAGILILALIVALFLPFSVILIQGALTDTPPKIGLAIIALVIGLSALLALYGLYKFVEDLEVYNDRLVVKSPLGYTRKIILLSDVDGWNEFITQSIPYLIIYTSSGYLKISSNVTSNYEPVRDFLIKGKNRRNDEIDFALQKTYRKIAIVSFCLVGPTLLLWWLFPKAISQKNYFELLLAFIGYGAIMFLYPVSKRRVDD